MVHNVELIFCTYFKRIEKFRYACETYKETVAFCVKQGSFSYQIGENKEQTASEGDVVICPPNTEFRRKIITPIELCMIKFLADDILFSNGNKIKVLNILLLDEDLSKLEGCLFCDTLSENPQWAHYCMDIIYIAIDSIYNDSKIGAVKQYIDQNYNKNLLISAIAAQAGYTVPHLINKFKACYGVSPKAYLSQIKIQKAKELLLISDMLSREVAAALGFDDELYFIRFFKKHTGTTPKQFKNHTLANEKSF